MTYPLIVTVSTFRKPSFQVTCSSVVVLFCIVSPSKVRAMSSPLSHSCLPSRAKFCAQGTGLFRGLCSRQTRVYALHLTPCQFCNPNCQTGSSRFPCWALEAPPVGMACGAEGRKLRVWGAEPLGPVMPGSGDKGCV
jgi:hypothetical protein